MASVPPDLRDRIYAGDCMDLLERLPEASVDLVVSSPPYNVGKEYESKRDLSDYLARQTRGLEQCARVLKDTASIFWQVGSYVDPVRHVPLDVKFFPILEDLGLLPRNPIGWIRAHGLHASRKFSGRHETILWFARTEKHKFFLDPVRVPQKYPDKKHWKGENHGELSCDPMGKNPGDVWAFRNVRHNHEEQTVHPAQFPEDLVERIVMATTEPGDVVLDPYMGVGTVALVAKRWKRHFVGAELDREYLDVANHRLSGSPDAEGNFPNLRSLREYAEKQGVTDVSRFAFTRQVGRKPTTRRQARITPEQMHLELFLEQTEGEARHPAFKRCRTTRP